MDFDDIIDGMKQARSRGYEADELYVSDAQAKELKSDANFKTASTPPSSATGNQLGTALGLGVNVVPSLASAFVEASNDTDLARFAVDGGQIYNINSHFLSISDEKVYCIACSETEIVRKDHPKHLKYIIGKFSKNPCQKPKDLSTPSSNV